MRKLLSAGLIRLRKSRIFWLLSGFMLAFGLYYPIALRMQADKYGFTATIESPFFTHVMLMGVLTAIFISLFIGTEYSDGTIRNKLIIGHSRTAIYFSNLAVCTCAVLFIAVCYMLPCACAGIPLLGSFSIGTSHTASLIACTLFIELAYTALFTLAAMLIHNKASLATVTILTAFLMLFASSYLYAQLLQPKMWTDYIEEDGQFIQSEPIPNEYYVTGTKRKVYTFLMEFMPSGQATTLMSGDLPLTRVFLYDSLIVVLCTGIGLFAFSRKDIK